MVGAAAAGAINRDGAGMGGAADGGGRGTPGDADGELKRKSQVLEESVRGLAGAVKQQVERATAVEDRQLALMEKLLQLQGGDSGMVEKARFKQLPGSRPLLGGDKQLERLGFELFKEVRERGERLEARLWSMDRPFARRFNKVLRKQHEVEGLLLELKLMSQDGGVVQDEKEFAAQQARKDMLEEQWIVIDDKKMIAIKCSELASHGKAMEAEEMWRMAKEDQYATEEASTAAQQLPFIVRKRMATGACIKMPRIKSL